MPSPKSRRRGGLEKSKGKPSEKSPSFHERGGEVMEMLPRPRTVPAMLPVRRAGGSLGEDAAVAARSSPKMTKLLLNVTVQRSLGAVRVLMPPEATVEDLIAAALRQYAKEARMPLLPSIDASGFHLHYSQFSLESLDKQEKLIALGSRNFFLCPKKAAEAAAAAAAAMWPRRLQDVQRKTIRGLYG